MEVPDGADGIFEHNVVSPQKALSFDEDRGQEVCLEAVEALQRLLVAVRVLSHAARGSDKGNPEGQPTAPGSMMVTRNF